MFSLFRMRTFHKKVLSAVLVLGFLAAVMGGCGTVGDDDTNYPGILPASLAGKWVFDSDNNYEIKGKTLKYVSMFGGTDYGFEGIIEFVSNYSNRSGIIIYKYTTGIPEAGKPYSGTYYQNLNSNTVQLANVWDLTAPGDWGASADTKTLEEAINKFTKGKMGNYVNWANVQPYKKNP